MSKAEQLVALLEAGRAEQEKIYAALPEAERVANGTWEKWSPKDFLGHFYFWQNSLLNVFDTLNQTPPELEPFEVRNQKNYRYQETRSYDDVYTDYRASLNNIIEHVKNFSDAELSESGHFPRLPNGSLQATILGNSYTHTLSHLGELYAKRGEPEKGFELQEQAAAKMMEFDPSPRNKGVTLYNLACAYGVAGKATRAAELLREAFLLRPDLLEFSKEDGDFNTVRDQPEFQALYAN